MEVEDVSVKKNSWIIVAVSTALWFVSLLQGTGVGHAYKVYDRAMLVVLLCYAYQIFAKKQFNRIKKSTVIVVFILIVQNIYTNFKFGHDFVEYLEIYAIPILYSLLTLDEKQMRQIGLIYGAGGGVVLLAANFTKYFAGWDGNSVSQICFFSYAVFIASMFDIKKKEHQQRIIIYSFIYFILLWTLNSRSCILFSAFLLLCELGMIPARKTINKKSLLTWLLGPLLIAMVVAAISYPAVLASLNEWSQEYFNKTLYSGRDMIWVRGFEAWREHPLLGTGSLAFRWHNSAVSCLVGTGCVGYFIWLYVIRGMLAKACNYIDDNTIFGTVTAFLTIWLQQSLDLGIIYTHGNPVIFVLLGLVLARTNTLEKEEIGAEHADGELEDVQSKYNNTDI